MVERDSFEAVARDLQATQGVTQAFLLDRRGTVLGCAGALSMGRDPPWIDQALEYFRENRNSVMVGDDRREARRNDRAMRDRVAA